MRHKFVHHLGKITRHHPERIPRDVLDAALTEMDNEMACVLVGAFARKRVIGSDPGLERIGAIVNGGRGGCAQNSDGGGLYPVDLTAPRLVLSRDSFSTNAANAAQGLNHC